MLWSGSSTSPSSKLMLMSSGSTSLALQSMRSGSMSLTSSSLFMPRAEEGPSRPRATTADRGTHDGILQHAGWHSTALTTPHSLKPRAPPSIGNHAQGAYLRKALRAGPKAPQPTATPTTHVPSQEPPSKQHSLSLNSGRLPTQHPKQNSTKTSMTARPSTSSSTHIHNYHTHNRLAIALSLAPALAT
eukprot:8527725-Alexandrium_andersonii.AAC.1